MFFQVPNSGAGCTRLLLGTTAVFDFGVCSLSGRLQSAPYPGRERSGHEKTRLQWFLKAGLAGGSYRDRTDDIHGVNVALYQLS